MTTKPKALKYRIRRSEPLALPGAGTDRARADAAADTGAGLPATAPETETAAGRARDAAARPGGPAPTPDAAGPAAAAAPGPGAEAAPPTDLDAIRREGLTGRQLRMARRIAQKQGLAVTSDFDAVRQLRLKGIDPFRRANILELVVPQGAAAGASAQQSGGGGGQGGDVGPPRAGLPIAGGGGDRIQLPQTVRRTPDLPSRETGTAPDPAAARAAEIRAIQADIAWRRRRKLSMLFVRLSVFVGLPTLLVGWYFAVLATPMYATKSEFVIQQAESQGAAGLGGLFSGTSMATQQDSISVQSFLLSREAFRKLDAEEGFAAHFSADRIDPLRRLEPDASGEDAYRLYQKMVRVSYDPTEGLLKMEVVAADPAVSQRFSEALIGYAEERIDALTQRVREDAMQGARASYEEAEARRAEALQTWLDLQQELEVVDPIGETSVKTSQIAQLESQRQQLQLELQTRLNVQRPNQAQVDALRSQISGIDGLIAELRSDLTEATADGSSLASKNTELRLAEENYGFKTIMVQQALQQMETARIEANRQVRYLETGVAPLAPDMPTYPRVFENTSLAFLVFAGIYLMVSLTASILREQVSS